LGLKLEQDLIEDPRAATEMVLEAERLGFDSVWTSESTGYDALTPLAWLGRSTHRIRLCAGPCQISARSPSAMAMAAMTLDHLAGGRLAIGLDLSGPHVDEGWFGCRIDDPLGLVEEYVQVIRLAMDRSRALSFNGRYFSVPATDGTGLAKPMKSIVHPLRPRIPLIINGDGFAFRQLATQVADGWMSTLCIPGVSPQRFPSPDRAGCDEIESADTDFNVIADVPVAIDNDIERAVDSVRQDIAGRIGRLVDRSLDVRREELVDLGLADVLLTVHEHWKRGRASAAGAAVPSSLVRLLSLVGSKDKIRDDLEQWSESQVSSLVVTGDIDTLRVLAELVS
jgi:F420-dependent oxidoreductase-like protein